MRREISNLNSLKQYNHKYCFVSQCLYSPSQYRNTKFLISSFFHQNYLCPYFYCYEFHIQHSKCLHIILLANMMLAKQVQSRSRTLAKRNSPNTQDCKFLFQIYTIPSLLSPRRNYKEEECQNFNLARFWDTQKDESCA